MYCEETYPALRSKPVGTVSVSIAGAGFIRLDLNMAHQILEEADRHTVVLVETISY